MPYAIRNELFSLLRLAGPLIAAQLAHVLMIFTDTVMMARLGPASLAGGALGAASYSFVTIVATGIIAAVGTLAAYRHGAHEPQTVTRLTQAGLWIAGALAILAALMLWNLGPILSYFGQTSANIAAAQRFMLILPCALPGYFGFMVLRGFTSAIGRTGPVMTIALGGAAANFALNTLLIDGLLGLPQLGLLGIGLVTAVVTNSMLLIMALYIRRQPAYAAYSLRTGLLQPQWATIKEVLRLGLPIGGTYAVESGLFTFASFCVGTLGGTALAAHQIALQSVTVAFMLPVGLSYAVSLRIGHHRGSANMQMARYAGRLGLSIGAACMLVFALAFWLMPEAVIGLYVDTHNPAYQEVVRIAVQLLAIAALFELFDGLQSIAMGAMRGLGNGKTPFMLGVGCYWAIGAPTAWVLTFNFGWGAPGVWWGLAIGLACAALSLIISFERQCARALVQEQTVSTKNVLA